MRVYKCFSCNDEDPCVLSMEGDNDPAPQFCPIDNTSEFNPVWVKSAPEPVTDVQQGVTGNGKPVAQITCPACHKLHPVSDDYCPSCGRVVFKQVK